ncbi:MAG TPA: metallophosphoesterase family protein [Methylovirgula sp.]|nr:metallophosphoesterase family protein [Methylovirgula sp.]
MPIFFTSDTHFGDAKRIRVDRRPFASIAEHDAALIARWNEVVGVEDEIYHLGDFTAFKDPDRVSALLAALNGRKHLVIGNNDPPTTTANKGWISVAYYEERMVEDRLLILCHYPFRTWHDMGKGAIDLHGHSHGKLKEKTRQYDVGVDVFDYRPVTLAEILRSKRRRKID